VIALVYLGPPGVLLALLAFGLLLLALGPGLGQRGWQARPLTRERTTFVPTPTGDGRCCGAVYADEPVVGLVRLGPQVGQCPMERR
jgi:hypothetical protein